MDTSKKLTEVEILALSRIRQSPLKTREVNIGSYNMENPIIECCGGKKFLETISYAPTQSESIEERNSQHPEGIEINISDGFRFNECLK
jgi:hypothetical protein